MTHRTTVLRNLSTAVVILGLASAVVLYRHASQAANPLGDFEDNKQYLRQMELYGGKSNVLAEQIREWFSGLWHGTSLAFTVAFLSVLVAGGLRLAAIPLPPLEEEETGERGASP